jgi:N-acetylmuramoyl-L-alanine amidase
MDFIERPSPNFDERALPVSMIVLHYTGMPDCEGALDAPLLAPSQGFRPLLRRRGRDDLSPCRRKQARLACRKVAWRGVSDVNSASVGIEIVNPGHEFGYREFPDEQVAALIPLVASVKERHGIGRGNVVGHSDVAPARKEDPGELFPWERARQAAPGAPKPDPRAGRPLLDRRRLHPRARALRL